MNEIGRALDIRPDLPEIGPIINSPAEMAERATHPAFVRRSAGDDKRYGGVYSAPPLAFASTEAELLQEYDDNLLRVRQVAEHMSAGARLRELDHIDMLRTRLGFIGTKELQRGAVWMAQSLESRLQESEELFVAVRPYKSSSYVYSLVKSLLDETAPETAAKLIPFDASMQNMDGANYRTRDRIAAAGVCFIDDWLVYGSQMSNLLQDLREFSGLKLDTVDIMTIAASGEQVSKGLGLDMVPCQSMYVDRREDAVRRIASLTGIHGAVDTFGFGLHDMRNGLADGVDYALPQLTHIERVYEAKPVQRANRRGNFGAYIRARSAYKKSLSDLVDLGGL